MSNNQFFFVYDPQLSKYLKFEKNINFITTGLNPTSKRQFWMYWQNDEVTSSVNEYISNKNT